MAKPLTLSRDQITALDDHRLRKTLLELQRMAVDPRKKNGREQAAAQLLVVEEVMNERARAKQALQQTLNPPPSTPLRSETGTAGSTTSELAVTASASTADDQPAQQETLPQSIPELLAPEGVIDQYEDGLKLVLTNAESVRNQFGVAFDPLWRMKKMKGRLRWGKTEGPGKTHMLNACAMSTDVVLTVVTPDSDFVGEHPLFQRAGTGASDEQAQTDKSLMHLVQPWRLTPEWAGIAIAGMSSEVHALQERQQGQLRDPSPEEHSLMKSERFGARTFAAEALSGGALRRTMEEVGARQGIDMHTSASDHLMNQRGRFLRFAQEVCLCITQAPPLCFEEAELRINTVYQTLIRLQHALGAAGEKHVFGTNQSQAIADLGKVWIEEVRWRIRDQRDALSKPTAPTENPMKTVPEILEPQDVIAQYDAALERLLREAASSTSQFGPSGNLFSYMSPLPDHLRWGVSTQGHEITLPIDTDAGKHTLFAAFAKENPEAHKNALFQECCANMPDYPHPPHYPIAYLIQPYRLTSEWAAVVAAGHIRATMSLQEMQHQAVLEPSREQRKGMRTDMFAAETFAAEVLSQGTLVPTIERAMATHCITAQDSIPALILADPKRMLRFFQEISGCVTREPPLCVDEAYTRIFVSHLSCIRFQYARETEGRTDHQLGRDMRAAMWELAETWIQQAYPHTPALPEDERRRPLHSTQDPAETEAPDPELVDIPPSVAADVRNAHLGARLELANRNGGDPGEACKKLLAEKDPDRSDPQVRMMLRAGIALERWRQDASLMATLKAHAERLMSLQLTEHRRSIDLRNTPIADDNCPLAPQLVSRLLAEMRVLEGWETGLSAEDITVTLSVIVQLMRKLEVEVVPNGGSSASQRIDAPITRSVIYSILRHLAAHQPNIQGVIEFSRKSPAKEEWNIGATEYLAWQPQSTDPINVINRQVKSSFKLIGCQDALKETEMLRQLTDEFADLYPACGRHRRSRNGNGKAMNVMTRVPGSPEKHLVMSTVDPEKGTMLVGRSPSVTGLAFGDRIPLDHDGTFPAMLPCVPSYRGDDNAETLRQLDRIKAAHFQSFEERLGIVAPELLTQPDALRFAFFLCDGERTTVIISEANKDKVGNPPHGFNPQDVTEAIVERTRYLSKNDSWMSFELPTIGELEAQLFTGTQVAGRFLHPSRPTSSSAAEPTAVTRADTTTTPTLPTTLPRLHIVRNTLLKLRERATFTWDDGTDFDPATIDFSTVAPDDLVIVTLPDRGLQFIVSNDSDRGMYVVHTTLPPNHYTGFDAEQLHNTHGGTRINFDNPDQFRESIELLINTQRTSPRTVYPVNCAYPNPLKGYPHRQDDVAGVAKDTLALDTLRADFTEAATIAGKNPWDLIPTDFHDIESGTILWRFGGNGAGGTYLERLARELGMDAHSINEERRREPQAPSAAQPTREARQYDFRLAALLCVQHELYPAEMQTSPVQEARRGRWQRVGERAAVREAGAGQEG